MWITTIEYTHGGIKSIKYKTFRTCQVFSKHSIDAGFFLKIFALPCSLAYTISCWKEVASDFGRAGLCFCNLCFTAWGRGMVTWMTVWDMIVREWLLNGIELALAGSCYNAMEWNSGWSESVWETRETKCWKNHLGFGVTKMWLELENPYFRAIYSWPWFCLLENGDENHYFLGLSWEPNEILC